RAPDFPFEHVFAAPSGAPAEVAAARGPRKEQIPYDPAPPPLDPITDRLSVICHASPDAGWPTLKAFFERIQQKLTVGIYDFTSAHILSGLENALTSGGNNRALSLVLDHPTRNPSADQSDEQTEESLKSDLANSLSFAWAPVRSSPEVREWIFPSAYHIKVAVRDSGEMWLSSGNWNNSNQPEDAPLNDPDPAHAAETFKKSDRDWHVIIASPQLAQLYEAYLLNDEKSALPAQGRAMAAADLEAFAEQAFDLAETNPAAAFTRAPMTFFAPLPVTEQMTIQPLLTPDRAADDRTGMYAEKMLDLISNAQSSLYIQLQYIHPSNRAEDEAFTELLNAVAARAAAGVDVRIILSQWQNTQWMERLRAAGINTDLVRIQQGVHNKGFVVDHRKTVVSSQNWSGAGVLENRDAGLIIDNATIAQYFEKIFVHDWDNVAVGHHREAQSVGGGGGNRPQAAGASGMPGNGGAGHGGAATAQILGWQDDPGEAAIPLVPPEARPVPDLTLSPLSLAIPGVTAPQPRSYDLASVDFRYWSAAEAAARGAAFWRQLLPQGTVWQLGDTLPIKLDEGEDFNAFYDRQALNFFHGTAAGRTVYSGESPDIVCHEQGHAILDAIRPELFDAGSIEAAAFHESFGDMSAILVALQLPTLRAAVLSETGGDLTRSSRLSRLAEQLGWAIRQFSPDSVERDCLRNAVNSFVYTNPEGLPSNAPAASLSSEPHSFSRVFTAAFFEAIAGGFRLAGPNPGEADLQTVSLDLARLLISGILATPIVPEYMSQVAASIVAADADAEGRARGKYGDVLKAGFVRHGVLSPQSAVSVATMHMAGVAALAHPGMMAIAGPGGPAAGRGRQLPHVALSAAEYGLGERPLLVRAPSDPRRFAVSGAAFGVGSQIPSNSEHAARAFVEDLLQRGHIDLGNAGHPAARIVHPHAFKTHRLVPTPEGLALTRILFDCGLQP
ncbi:MAG: phospholipase D-like domain-containing protein, partial [Stellaceae bacterium]